MAEKEQVSLPIMPSTAADLRRAGVTIVLCGILLLVIGWRFWVGQEPGDPAGGVMMWVVGGVLVVVGTVVTATAKRRGAPESTRSDEPSPPPSATA